MSGLTTGSSVSKWSAPYIMHNYCTGEDYNPGWAWDIDGGTKATMDDVEALYMSFGQVKLDIPTLFGGDPFYKRHADDKCFKPPVVVL